MTKEVAINVLKSHYHKNPRTSYSLMVKQATEMAIEALKERKTGKWFDNVDIYDKRAQRHDYFCLECKTHAMDFIGGYEDWWCCKPPKYCPNCGARMEVEHDEQ